MSVLVEELPNGDSSWRVDGIGRFASPGNESDPLVTLHLSELHRAYSNPLSNESLTGRGATARVKAGQIVLFKHGSVWHNKVRQPTPGPKIVALTLSHDQLKLCRFGGSIELDGRATSILPRNRYLVSTESWKGLADSWCAVAVHPSPGLQYIVIPSSVLFQQCLATSPKAVRRLVFGNLGAIIPAAHWMPDEPTTFYVEVDKNIRTGEVEALANLWADPIAKAEYSRFRHALIADTVNDDRARTPRPLAHQIALSLPFSNPVNLEVMGKHLKVGESSTGKNLWAFLVTEIFSLSTRLVFDRLIVHRLNDARKGKNEGDPSLPATWPTPAKYSADIDDEDDLSVHSGADPLSTLDAICLQESGGFEAIDLEVIRDPKVTQGYRSRVIAGVQPLHDRTATTGDGRSGVEGAVPIDIEAVEVPRVPVTLDQFFETLELLRREGLAIETIVVADSSRRTESGDFVNFLPRKINGMRQWHLIPVGKSLIPKGYVVAVIEVGGVWRHFIELERKGTESPGLAYIRDASGSRIEPRRLDLFMIDIAKSNGWNADICPQWIFESIHHSPSRGIKPFARSIAKALGFELAIRAEPAAKQATTPPTSTTFVDAD